MHQCNIQYPCLSRITITNEESDCLSFPSAMMTHRQPAQGILASCNAHGVV